MIRYALYSWAVCAVQMTTCPSKPSALYAPPGLMFCWKYVFGADLGSWYINKMLAICSLHSDSPLAMNVWIPRPWKWKARACRVRNEAPGSLAPSSCLSQLLQSGETQVLLRSTANFTRSCSARGGLFLQLSFWDGSHRVSFGSFLIVPTARGRTKIEQKSCYRVTEGKWFLFAGHDHLYVKRAEYWRRP